MRRCPPAKLDRGENVVAVQDDYYFLFLLARWQDISPRFRFALPRKEFQVVPEFARHWFGLALDFRKQHFLSAHDVN